MRKLLVIAFLLFCAYTGWQKLRPAPPLEPLYELPYVVVYGRDSCGYTQQMRRALAKARVPFHYEHIDEQPVRDVMHRRMRSAKIDTSLYTLPVVEVSTRILVHPDPGEVVAAYLGN